MIAHSSSEFVLDFIQLMPGVPKAKVKSRIIITPEHAKKFSSALLDNISKYEKKYSEQNDFDRLKSDYEILKLSNGNKYLLLKKIFDKSSAVNSP